MNRNTDDTVRPLRERLLNDVDSLVLVFLRVGTGVAIFFWAWLYCKPVDYDGQMLPLYDPVFMKPRFLFKYAGFEWVKLWPGNGIGWHFFVTQIAALFLAVGFLTRVSAAILCGSIAYVLLVERQIYLNHYYLLSCLAGLMVFLPVGRRFSIDALLGIERSSFLFPRWQLWLLRFQVGIPYVYGALAKVNGDWMAGQPAGIFLDERRGIWLADLILQLPHAALLFAWGGLLYDLLVVPMLLYRKTRWLAVAMSLGFHLSNSQLFNIGVFPWFMLAAVIVFFPADAASTIVRRTKAVLHWWLSKYTDQPATLRHLRVLTRAEHTTAKRSDVQLQAELDRQRRNSLRTVGFYLAVLYVAVQLVLPIRQWVLPGNPSWNERGHRYSWRMMLRRKRVLTTFKVVALDGSYQFFPSRMLMTQNQSIRAERNPELVRQAAIKMKEMVADLGVKDAKIYCLCLASLNGRRPVPIIDPDIDLSTARRGWFVDDWVNQDQGPLLDRVWNQDTQQWWTELVLPKQFKPLELHRPSELELEIAKQKQAEGAATSP